MHRSMTHFITAWMLIATGVVWCDEPQLALSVTSAGSPTPPLLDDAGLNDVQLLGNTHGWAVGDRGVIWQTTDGGQHWTLVPSPVACRLQAVCFLTNRVGWIVGGSVSRRGQESQGVVLQTTDGGKSWKQLGDVSLPLLHDVQFFDLEQGIVVGESNAASPTGVQVTNDGGQTWRPVAGEAGEGWRALGCHSPDTGFVAGLMGRYTTISGGRLQQTLAGASGLRGVTDVAMSAERRGWLVGDGGLLLRTQNAGIAWGPPEGEVPRVLRDVMDFRAVAAVGDSVWVAGHPGSVVWHSDDGGSRWTSQPTGHSAPIDSLSFSSPTHGCAVGALGSILRTTDGGATWTAVRGARRRAALLAIHAHESRVSLNLTTKYGGELGYRTVTAVASRRDVGPDAADGRLLDVRLHDALTAAGGNNGLVDWAFPIAAPGLDRNQTELVREWQLLTDNRLRETMLSRLVCLLCAWRPEVVVIDEPAADDAATNLLVDAVRLAVQQAADPAQHAELRDALHLSAWEVKRLFRRLPMGSEGPVRLDAFEFLPRLGKSLTMAAAEPYRRLSATNVTAGQRETYVSVPLGPTSDENAAEVRNFFAGLTLSPGGAARRALTMIDDDNFDEMQSLAQQQRNFAAYASRMLDNERQAAQLVGQTADIVGAAPDDQAAVQLLNLADEYRLRGDWENAQAVLVELSERYPEEPAAIEAMMWLLRFWSSDEVAWQRLRTSTVMQKSRLESDSGILPASLQQSIDSKRAGSGGVQDAALRSAMRETSVGGQVLVGGRVDRHEHQRQEWLKSAERIFEKLQQRADAEITSPGNQFLLASRHRRQNHPRLADDIYRRFIHETSGGAWSHIASGEIWLAQPQTVAPHAVVRCIRAARPPVLDGHLHDPCWQSASVMPLRNEAEHRQTKRPFVNDDGPVTRPQVRLAYDANFLYIAARVPREATLSSDKPHYPGRTDDADLTDHDRLHFAFDTDRDYTTFYRIDVDQRGWTSDACWENEAWNCQRYIAATSDESEWRIEMAIPFQELVSQSPQSGDTWATAVARVMPTIGVESWTVPSGSRPRPEGFGLLWFQ